jgi:hypothetical protein
VADTRCLDLNQHLAGTRTVELDGRDFKGFAGCKGNGSANIHEIVSSVFKSRAAQLCSGGMTICV